MDIATQNTPKGLNVYRKTDSVGYSTPKGSYHSPNYFSISILSLRDITILQITMNPKGSNKK